jgi:transcriptional regulator with XRE-family HTH domain
MPKDERVAPTGREVRRRRPAMLTDERILALGRELRRRRQARGLSLDSLGEVAGLTPNYVGSIELGRRDPSLSTMIRIAQAMGSEIGELLGLPDMTADSIEAARLLSALPAQVRAPVVNALREMATWAIEHRAG